MGKGKKRAHSCMLLHNSAPLADVLPCDTENRKSMGEDTQDAAVTEKTFCPCRSSAVQFGLFYEQVKASRNSAFPSHNCSRLKSFDPIMWVKWRKGLHRLLFFVGVFLFVCIQTNEPNVCNLAVMSSNIRGGDTKGNDLPGKRLVWCHNIE